MVTTHCPSCQPPVGPRVPQGHHGARGQGGSHCTNDNPLLDHKNTEEDTKGETSKGETSMGQLAPSSRYSAIFEPAGHRLVHGPAQNQITQPQNGPGNTQTSSLAGGGGGVPQHHEGPDFYRTESLYSVGLCVFPKAGNRTNTTGRLGGEGPSRIPASNCGWRGRR